jgi:hypothetical protein
MFMLILQVRPLKPQPLDFQMALLHESIIATQGVGAFDFLEKTSKTAFS